MITADKARELAEELYAPIYAKIEEAAKRGNHSVTIMHRSKSNINTADRIHFESLGFTVDSRFQ